MDYKTTHCEQHTGQVDKDYNRFARDERSAAFYNSPAWRNLRKSVLAENPLCVRCMEDDVVEPAVVCDHIVPIRVWWEGRLIKENLQGLCRSCDNIKRAEEHKQYGKGRMEE